MSVQDYCMPEPSELPQHSKLHEVRPQIKKIMYGQVVYIVLKTLTMSVFGGIFQIINLWMLYLCFATMHFC